LPDLVFRLDSSRPGQEVQGMEPCSSAELNA
jgi:hypothetical protein